MTPDQNEKTDHLNERRIAEANDIQIEKIRSIDYNSELNMLVVKQEKRPHREKNLYTTFGAPHGKVDPDDIQANAVTVFNVKEISIGGFGEPAREILSHASEANITENNVLIGFDPRTDRLNPFIQFAHQEATSEQSAYLEAVVTYTDESSKETI